MSNPERIGAPDGAIPIWFVHGILGQGRNWRSFARRVVELDPRLVAYLPDLRGHGGSPAPPPNTVASCADDLDELARIHGVPAVVVGHSFGGKVALSWLARQGPGPAAVILDSPPGTPSARDAGATDPTVVLRLLRSIVTPATDRESLRRPLLEAGIPVPVASWLLTSARQDPDGWRWQWDFDAVQSLLADYFALDLRPFLAETGSRVVLVRAGRSDRWSPDDDVFPVGPRVTRLVLPEAGHWVHVDDPEGTFAIVRDAVREALGAPPGLGAADARG